jgi:tetratricopeptide (TPR) repeat protein
LIGVFVALVWGGLDLAARLGIKAATCGRLAASVVSACLVASCFHVKTWQNTRTLFEQALRVTEANYLAHAVLGTLLTQEAKHEEATIHFNQALEAKPTYFEGHTAFGNALLSRQQYAGAALHFETALKYNHDSLDALNGIGSLLLQTGRPQEALASLERALQIDPHFLPARINHALALMGAGQGEAAFAGFSALQQIQPAVGVAVFGLGNLLLAQGKTAEALPYFRLLVRLQPDHVPALGRLAWILATHRAAEVRDGPEAVRLAARACELTASADPLILNSLAAAYAESGKFEEAARSAQRALQVAKSQGNTNLASIVQSLLESYVAKRPHRE